MIARVLRPILLCQRSCYFRILAIVLGAPLVFWLLRRLTAPEGSAAAAAGPAPKAAPATGGALADADLAAEVDRELRELDA